MIYSISQSGSLIFNRVVEVQSANQLEQELMALVPKELSLRIEWDDAQKKSGTAFLTRSGFAWGFPIYIDKSQEDELGKKGESN